MAAAVAESQNYGYAGFARATGPRAFGYDGLGYGYGGRGLSAADGLGYGYGRFGLGAAPAAIAAVPVAAGHWGVEAHHDKLQSKEANVGAQLGQPVLTRGGCCGGGRVPGVHHVARVEADLEVTSGGAEDAASPEAGGTGAISQGPGPPLTLGGGDTCSR